MQQYLELLKDIKHNGSEKDDRTNTGTTSIFGRQVRYDLRKDFPLLTTKKVHLRGIIHELLWFLKGYTNIKYLNDNNVSIWDSWAAPEDTVNVYKTLSNLHTAVNQYVNGRRAAGYQLPEPDTSIQFSETLSVEEWRQFIRNFNLGIDPETVIVYDKRAGDLGPVYGKQWRCWEGKDGIVRDQIKTAIDLLRNDPDSRRIIVSAWNVGELEEMALMPCHTLFQFYTRVMTTEERFSRWLDDADEEALAIWRASNCITAKDWATSEQGLAYPTRELSLQLYQRSCDVPIGAPYNIASYSALVLMICDMIKMVPGDFIHTMGDAHIYDNQMEQIDIQLERKPRALPKLYITRDRKITDLSEYKFEDFVLFGYDPHPAIKMPVAV